MSTAYVVRPVVCSTKQGRISVSFGPGPSWDAVLCSDAPLVLQHLRASLSIGIAPFFGTVAVHPAHLSGHTALLQGPTVLLLLLLCTHGSLFWRPVFVESQVLVNSGNTATQDGIPGEDFEELIAALTG